VGATRTDPAADADHSVILCAVVCLKDSKGGQPVVVGDDEARVRAERARAIGLFRYQLIREAADPAHSTKERGKIVRELASREHTDPFGRRVRISRQTIDRWIRDWRAGGFDALVPSPRQCTPRTPAEVLELAVALRRENPDRTAAAIRRILRTQLGWAPDERTLQRNFHRLGLTAGTGSGSAPVFGRFEAEHPNDLWTGDALHGIAIAARKTYLFAFLDDHSRLLPGYRWGYAELCGTRHNSAYADRRIMPTVM
jgi:putative transposase